MTDRAMLPTAKAIIGRLRRLALPDRASGMQRFFKTGPGEYGEGDRFLGLTLPLLRQLAREYSTLSLKEALVLLRSPWHEARLLALLILVAQHRRGDSATRDRIHVVYLKSTKRINNWDLVDCSAEFLVGAHVDGRGRTLLRRLARSPLLWERRIAMIATFHDIKKGEFDAALDVAGLLVADRHDLIHKAVGWMLREIGKRDRGVEEAFLHKHAAAMPRTMLRYAIERFPPRRRREYMEYGTRPSKRAR